MKSQMLEITRTVLIQMNPPRKPVDDITDRAKELRAQ